MKDSGYPTLRYNNIPQYEALLVAVARGIAFDSSDINQLFGLEIQTWIAEWFCSNRNYIASTGKLES